jgi:glucose/galactose transporter
MSLNPGVRDGRAQSNVGPMLIIGVLFFIFGFVTWLNGPLIAFAKVAFNASDITAFLIPMAFYLSYFFLAIPSSWILKGTGMKRGMALGLLVMAVGAALFGQFATMRVYSGTLIGLFVIGAGLALLQTAANPYISILGPIDSAARRIAFMGICNKAAGAIAPWIIGGIVLAGIGGIANQVQAATSPAARNTLINQFAAQIHVPYLIMAAVLVALAIWVARSSLPEVEAEANNAESGSGGGILHFPHLWLGVVCLFLYVGVEVMAGDAIGTYGHAFGIPLGETRFFTSFTLVAMLVGYLVGLAIVPRFVSQERYLAYSAVLGIGLVLAAFSTGGYTSVAFVATLGFANSMMWPAIFPLAIRGLGRHTEFGSALMVMGIAGGAVIPQIFVHLKEHLNFQLVFLILVAPCYLYILFYATYGHRVGTRAAPSSFAIQEP